MAEQRCELVTVVGDPGIGKSRLAAEALASIEARVVRGRCLPYGAGITYWPVVEIVKQLDVLPTDPAAAAAIRSLLGESGRWDVGGGDRLGVPQAARGAGAAGGRLRRHPVGRGDVPRPDRARRAALERCAAAAALHGAAGAARQPPLLAGDDPARAARRQRDAASSDRSRRAGGAAGEDRRRRRRQPALHQRDARDGPARRRRGRGAGVVEGAAGGAARPARPGRTAGARVRLGRGRGLPPRRRPSA